MTKVVLSAPFAKTVETEDGGREVWGFASLELKDKSGEIADFNGTVKAFEKWSNDTAKRTNGKSLGNVRLMHKPEAIGKTTHWEPTETTVQDEEGNEQIVKGIWVGAYVPPTKADVIRDIDEGILSAFSIGGAYEKRWWSQDDQAFRYIPELSEYSLVDNPCVPGADIVNVISKADGPWNRKEEEEMSEELTKDNAPKGGENNMQKGDGTMDLEQVVKAAAELGISTDQTAGLLKALADLAKANIDQPPAPVSVSTVDGDGDEDKNKEFPAPPEGDEKINIPKAMKDSDQSEKDSGVAAKAADGEVTKAEMEPDDNQPDDENCPDCGGKHKLEECDMPKAEKSAPAELEKAGKSISNKNGAHLQHAANHIGAVMKGADYTAADHLVVESQVGQGGTGEEAPEVDVEKMFANIFTPIIEATVKKATDALLQKSADSNKGLVELSNQFESLAKGLASQDDLKKAMGEIESIKALVKEIHETPQVGGPILNGGSPDLALLGKSFNQANVSQIEIQALEKFAKETKDPIVKDRVGQEIARRQMNDVFKL